MTEEDKNSALFASLVLMFQTAAMQHLGKLKNPVTDKIERDLTQAQVAIDMLDMLQGKTKGNVSETEKRYLTDTIRELKLNYVDELSKEEAEKKGKASEAEKKESA